MTQSQAWWNEFDRSKKLSSRSSSYTGFKGDEWSTGTERCYHKHPALPIGDTGLVVFGGSCAHPQVADADIYIGFDGCMVFTKRQFPWHAGHEILYRVTDMSVPKEVTEYRRLVEWTAEQLHGGQKVHCGCVGGHGRTGMFLAALLKHMTGDEDAIATVRKLYCSKAVETGDQVKWLGEFFGIKPVAAIKAWSSSGMTSSGGGTYKSAKGSRRGSRSISPIRDSNNIYGNW